MATINVGGQTLYFTQPMKVTGGPVLLLVHGAGGTHLDWPKEIQQIPGTSIYNLDLPGHGRSTGPGRSTIDSYADIVQEFIWQMAVQEVAIAGHSMGGAIAQTLALRGLPQIIKMALIASSAKLRVSPEVLHLASVDPNTAVDFIIRMSWGTDAANPFSIRGQKNMRQIDPAVLEGDLLACDRFDVRALLNQIGIPTLVISGTEDMMTPLKHGHYLAENIEGAHFVSVEEAGHFLMLQKPKLVADTLAEFLGV